MKRLSTLLILVLLCCKVAGQTFLAPVGIATVVSPGVYNLTPTAFCGGPYYNGAIWCTTTVDFTNSFTLTYQASFDHAVGPGADGIAVVFGQNITPTSANGTNAYLGYYNVIGGPPDADFNNSFGVEFDIFDNSSNAYFDDIPGTDHTAICLNAVPTVPITGPVAISPSSPNVKDGAFHDYKITWCPVTHTLQVFYDGTLRLSSVYNYGAVFTTPSAVKWGFTGGTGAACSNQVLQSISLVTGTCSTTAPCLVGSLVINTGYDPITALPVTGGANGATPVPDPKWRLTSVTPGVATAIAATPLPGLIEVIPGNKADVVTTAGWGASNPLSAWISCLNSNYYFTDGTGVTVYNMTLGRQFKLCSADSITFDCYLASDNYIPSTNVDGIPLLFTQPPTVLASNYNSFAHFTQTVFLPAGIHTFNVVVDDSNVLTPSNNPAGLNLHGTISSATGTASIVSDIDTTCSCAPLVYTCDSLSLPDSVHLCKNTTLTMPATLFGTDSILSIGWEPPAGLSDTSILTPVLTATVSGWYDLTVRSILPGNLVVNGDFSLGNFGFTSAYPYVSGPSSLVPAGVYAISTDPHNEHPGAATFYDHTTGTGTGNMMAINGASTPINVWCETITVSPNTWYDFSAWFANWSSDTSSNLPIIQFEINGVLIGSPFTFPHPDGMWTEFFTTWYSGTSTTAAICINDQQTAGFGNDFAIDDIAFQQLCIAKDSIYVAITQPDTIRQSADTSICSMGGSLTLNAPVAGNWLWSTGDVSQSISVTGSGTYWVDMAGGCDSLQSDTFHVTISPIPVVTLRTDTTICAGNSITLGSPEPPGLSYLWSTGSRDSSIIVSDLGIYSLVVTEDGCTAADSMALKVINTPPPFSLGPDTILCKGEEITLYTDAANTVWSTAQTGKSIVVFITGTYYATISNQCGSVMASIHVDVEPCDLYFPSAFTPNGDNVNDIARVVGNLSMYKGFSLSIYNRWGQRVFYTQDIYSGWDGEFQGEKQGLGTFFYMINYTLQGKSHMMKGDLQLIR